ncbi:hypothetical protein FB446DRAFT_714346 [Lentinula raphanica]|nr:hypothetical protein FB446DRAFT_714346 [Lentinula raphanica]
MTTSLTSTPIRKSSSKHTGERESNPNPDSQKELKDLMRSEIDGQVWQFTTDRLAKALSAKTRKRDVALFYPGQPDSLEYYNIDIDTAESNIAKAARRFVDGKPQTLLRPKNAAEKEHYEGLMQFFNKGVDECLAQITSPTAPLYKKLKFCVWDKPTNDGIAGAAPLKPDGVGVLGLLVDHEREYSYREPTTLYWSPPGEGEKQIEIPVEVKAAWGELLTQAGTYGRCLFSANPLRKFALVIGYNHKEHALRFLVFHRGGCTASVPLDLDKRDGQEDFIRLLFSVLTWRTRADAGFAEWCNDARVRLPHSTSDAVEVDVDCVLHYTFCVRGRAPRVFRLNVPPKSDQGKKPSLPNLVPATQILGLRRSERIRIQAQKDSDPSSGVNQRRSSRTPLSGTTQIRSEKDRIDSRKGGKKKKDEVVPISIDRNRASSYQLQKTGSFIHWSSVDPNSLKRSDFDNAVMKLCWVPVRGPNDRPIEPDLLKDCSNMFGVPKHLYSFQAYHNLDTPTTNHLFLPPPSTLDSELEEFRWHVLDKKSDEIYEEPERRSLLGHIMSDAGHSLVTAPDFPSLIRAILHALIGYYNMCQKNYQHRDLSIGNILMVDDPITTQPFEIANPNSIQQRILDRCKDLGIKDRCYGFVIDGDMAVNWNTYFEGKHEGTRSGTSEFMSDWLLNQMLKNHMHSPLDDFASFYFVTQWACVFRELPLEERSQCEGFVQVWQTKLAGNIDQRTSVTHQINHERLRANEYGTFLVQAQPFLKQWYSLIENLRDEFRDPPPEGWNAGIFRRIIDEVLSSFLKLVIDSKVLESMV